MGERGQHAHQLCIKQVAGNDVVVDQAPPACVIAKDVKDLVQRGGNRLFLVNAVKLHLLQQPVKGIGFILLLNKAAIHSVIYQRVKICFHFLSSRSTPP